MLVHVAGHALGWQVKNPAASCYAALGQDPAFALIRDKVALGGATDEMRRMTRLTDRASATERPVIGAWRLARADCHEQEQPYYASLDVNVGLALREHFAAVQTQIGLLEAGKLAYGEFSRRRLDLGEQVEQRIEAIRKQILPAKPAVKPLQP